MLTGPGCEVNENSLVGDGVTHLPARRRLDCPVDGPVALGLFLRAFFSLFSAEGGEVEYVGIPTYSKNFPKSDVFRIKFSSLRDLTE